MRPKIRSIILFAAVNLVSIVCLVFSLHGVRFRQLFSDIQHLDWRWAGAAIISGLLIYVIQGWRWSLVLAPVTPVPVWQSVRAVYVGLYANEVLPLRSGEIIRCYLQARWSEIPISVTLASALIERIFDGIWLIGGLFLAIRVVQLPRIIQDGGLFLAILVLVCAILLGIAMFWREQTLDALVNAPGLGWAHILIKDLHLIGHSRYLYFAFLVSLPCLLLQVFPVYAVMHAFSSLRELPLSASFVITMVLRLNSVLPQAPGNIGTFQWATIRGMLLFGVARNAAQRFAFILWGIVTLPLVLVGFIAVGLTGLDIGQLQRDARTSMQTREKTEELSG